jgi:MarR family transcriptional regulator, lower aerobic nicotinate degradation pathway regulator
MEVEERPGPRARPQLRWPTYVLGQLHRLGREQVDAALGAEGLSLRSVLVLACLSEDGELSQQQVADRGGIDRSDMVKLIDQLEALGMVLRRPDPLDRRRHVLSLTAKGQRASRQSEQIVQQVTGRVLSRLTTDERHTLHRLTLRALGEPEDTADAPTLDPSRSRDG